MEFLFRARACQVVPEWIHAIEQVGEAHAKRRMPNAMNPDAQTTVTSSAGSRATRMSRSSSSAKRLRMDPLIPAANPDRLWPDKFDSLVRLGANWGHGGRWSSAILASSPPAMRRVASPPEKAGIESQLFDDVRESHDRQRRRRPGRRAPPRARLLSVSAGGSSMDSAKGINFLYTSGGRMEDYGASARPRADAAHDRRTDDRRHRQRNAIVA